MKIIIENIHNRLFNMNLLKHCNDKSMLFLAICNQSGLLTRLFTNYVISVLFFKK